MQFYAQTEKDFDNEFVHVPRPKVARSKSAKKVKIVLVFDV